MSEPPDPTRGAMRPYEPGAAHARLWRGNVSRSLDEQRVLCLECRQCAKRTALTKQDVPQSRLGNVRYVLHASFKCSACGADKPRLYQATMDEAKMFLAGDPLRRQIGR
jgi:hypothetical protein